MRAAWRPYAADIVSILGHVAVGIAAARMLTPENEHPNESLGRMVAFAGLAMLPDVDFLLQAMAPAVSALAHRGASHSLAFALAVGAALAIAHGLSGGRRVWVVGATTSALVATHGMLDWLGDSDRGVALLWPLFDERFSAPWRLLPNPSFGLPEGLVMLAIEFAVFLPLWVYALAPRRC